MELSVAEIIKLKAWELKYEELLNDIEQEWRNLYHNASIRQYWPDIESDKEWDFFWELLFDESIFVKESLKEQIAEKFPFVPDLDLNFSGRGGATLYPFKWQNEDYYGYTLSGFNQDILNYYNIGEDNWLDDDDNVELYEEDCQVLECLKYINETVREGVKGIPQWWEQYKEGEDED